jgi:hypothetical protein
MGQPGIRLTWWLDRSGFVKRPSGATTRQNPVDPWPGRDPVFFFFKCGFSPVSFFFIFFSWLLTLFKVHYINIRRKKLFFQCGIWNPFVYILYVHKKKVMFFQCEIWNHLAYIFYVHKKNNYVFSMWDKKPFGLNTST